MGRSPARVIHLRSENCRNSYGEDLYIRIAVESHLAFNRVEAVSYLR